MKNKLYILGKSNYALAIIFDIVKLREWKVDLIIVQNIAESENSSTEFPFENGISYQEIGLSDFNPSAEDEFIIGSIGKSRLKIKTFFEREYGIQSEQYRSIIHPSAVIAESVSLGKGLHIGPMSVIAPFANLKDHSTINRNVSVGHHTTLEAFACLNPGVNVSGICSIGENVMIGAGATVLDQISIGSGSIIGAGSIVTRNIEGGVVAFGSPAKVIRRTE
jgi:sugar O-acyltransferase (sialic acid O-acetyltransferase NeuD family)